MDYQTHRQIKRSECEADAHRISRHFHACIHCGDSENDIMSRYGAVLIDGKTWSWTPQETSPFFGPALYFVP